VSRHDDLKKRDERRAMKNPKRIRRMNTYLMTHPNVQNHILVDDLFKDIAQLSVSLFCCYSPRRLGPDWSSRVFLTHTVSLLYLSSGNPTILLKP
jgi:hypothetical protein